MCQPHMRLFEMGKILFFCLFLLKISFPFDSASAAELEEQTLLVVDSYLKNKELESKGSVYRKANRFMQGDINNDNVNDLILLYTLEGVGGGGNNYSFYIAIFIKTQAGYKFHAESLAGGKSSRTLSFGLIENGVIQLNTKFITKKEDGLWDALYCPSGIGKAYYTLRGNKLVELNSSP